MNYNIMIYKIRILDNNCCLSINKDYYSMQNYEQLINYFFGNIEFKIVNINENADICLFSNHFTDIGLLRDNEINILISIENIINRNFHWYKHYNKYGEYGNKKIKIYIYNHIERIIKTDNYIAIPTIYTRINYYKKNYNNYKNHDKINTSFIDKKFCLMINKSGLNPEINTIVNELSKIDKIDNINMYNNLILRKSCYNSIELLNVLNKYKFIICYENSYNNGYITEKIFNCFFAKTIPIYNGSETISNYINENSFINVRSSNYIELIKELNENENLYMSYINSNKISNNYNDENYEELLLNNLKK